MEIDDEGKEAEGREAKTILEGGKEPTLQRSDNVAKFDNVDDILIHNVNLKDLEETKVNVGISRRNSKCKAKKESLWT